MSSLMKNVVQSALKSDELNIIVMNAANDIELAGLDFNIYTFNLKQSLVSTFLENNTLERNLCVYFDAIVNLRPFHDNLGDIINFASNWQIPIINYIVDIDKAAKRESLLRKSELIQKMRNFYERQEFASLVYIPNAETLTRQKFSAELREVL